MIKIIKWPIIILANYRTGSSALTYKISKDYNIPNFVEPTITEERKNNFFNHYGKTEKFIVKFMPDQIDSFTPYQELINSNAFKIKLSRKNKAEQIASHYIATIKDKWWTTENEKEEDYFIPIISEKIELSINRILSVEKMLDSYDFFDQILFYEDIGIIDGIDRKSSYKPKNYSRLINLIEKKL